MMQLSEAALATQGHVLGEDVMFTSVGSDSRNLAPEQLFVALHGENFDGHAYAKLSLEQGAIAAMISTQQGNITPALLVKDTRLALGDLAAHWRSKFDIPLAAITGSNGKTTVKEMLACILRAAAESDEAVLATQGNLNNDIGLPMTLLKLRAWHRYAVAEMGMNHAGEISYLTKLGKPTVALINNATTAHLGGLGSVEDIAKAKGEIFEGLAADGIAIINADDDYAELWKSLAENHKIITFGLNAQADVSATYQLHTDASDVQMLTPEGTVEYRLPVAGLHNVRNALAASTVALAMGVDKQKIALGLSAFGGVKGRLQHKAGLNDALVIDDTYNANPASMKAAIDVLAVQAGKKIMVMGDMGELGNDAAAMHAEIGSYARQAGVEALLVLGELTREAATAFGAGAQHFESPESLAENLQLRMQPGMTVLVKGSRFMRMERVVNLITTKNTATPEEKH
ncbi:MAG TPA: UDP-N-acetylmuramoyl-tripeptide--D-alanyl-D-alanine ligase [Methylophilaceae bacterium]|nr:UDP-N-acetylmuramoyl-tripeptide--D-alanyl-D-alanine ligase [Methylophilaceae bacterium]